MLGEEREQKWKESILRRILKKKIVPRDIVVLTIIQTLRVEVVLKIIQTLRIEVAQREVKKRKKAYIQFFY